MDDKLVRRLTEQAGIFTPGVDPDIYAATHVQMCKFAELVAEHVAKHAAYDSWSANPARPGGQFTDEEIYRRHEW